jgi:predicted nucleic-acid-binding Zn-ribbon protein
MRETVAGEENFGPKYAIRLSDLREWHIVTVTCFKCRYEAELTAGFLKWERPPHTYLTELERKLRCSHCGNREGNTLAVRAAPRN